MSVATSSINDSGPTSTCPKHSTSMPTSCSICFAWANIEKERKRLALGRERLNLELEIFKTDKRNHRRTNLLQTQVKQVNDHNTTNPAHVATSNNSSFVDYKEELEKLKVKYQEEQENNKIQSLEWKLKFQLQDSDLRHGQKLLAEKHAAYQDLNQQYQVLKKRIDQPQRETSNVGIVEKHHQNSKREEALQKEVDDLHQQLNSLRDQVILVNKLLANSSKEQLALKIYAEELQDKLERSQVENETYSKGSQAKSDYEHEIELLQEKLDKAQMEGNTIAKANEDINARCKELEDEVDAHVGKFTLALKENESYTKCNEELTLRCSELEDQINQQITKYEAQSKQTLELNARSIELEKQLEEYHGKLAEALLEKETYTKRNEELRIHCEDYEEVIDSKNEELVQAGLDAQRLAKLNSELNDRCKALEKQLELEHLGNQHRSFSHHHDDDDGTYLDEATAPNTCANCECFEEKLFDLRMQLERSRIEYQNEIATLKEKLDKGSGGSSAAANAPPAEIVHAQSPSRNNVQAKRSLEIDQHKMNMKLLAFSAKQEAIEREKRALEHELEESQRTVGRLALELEELQNERDEQVEKAEQLAALAARLDSTDREKLVLEHELELAKRKIREMSFLLERMHKERDKEKKEAEESSAKATALDTKQLTHLMHQIDILQKSQEAYATCHKENAQEWTGLVESLTQKQRHFMDNSLPSIDDKIKKLEQQMDELEGAKSAAVEQPRLGAVFNKNAQPLVAHSYGQGYLNRLPPLTKMDSQKHRHVTELRFESNGLSGLYTGFVDKNNLPIGHGVLREDHGDVYEGEWEHGLRQGHGVYSSYDGDLYTGPWSHGKRHGHGIVIYADGLLYDGQFNMDRKEGLGMLVWPRRAKYEGSFKNDKRNGRGEYVYADGRVYRGDYVDDRQHGYGVETARDGTVLYDGYWAFGEFVGDGADNGSVTASLLDPNGP